MSTSNDVDSENTTALPRIDKIVPVASTKWLALETIHYTDQEGKERLWDVATRTTKPKPMDSMSKTTAVPGSTRSTADAVVIIPLLKSSTKMTPLETILVEQYRPPVQQTTMEFPAGLVDANETVEEAALRELHEETGFVGEEQTTTKVLNVSRPVCMTPGLSTETVHCVIVEVDLDQTENCGVPTPNLDDGEHVKVHRVPLDEGLQTLLDTCPAMPIMGLYLFAVGFQMGQSSSVAGASAVASAAAYASSSNDNK